MEIWNSREEKKWRKRIVYRAGKDETRGWIRSFTFQVYRIFFFFFSQTRSQSSTATSKTRRVSVMTKVGHYQFSNCGIWGWQHKVTVNVTFHPFKRLRKIPERKFEKRVHQIPVINVASSTRETFMKKVLWFWTYSRYRVKKFRYPIIDDI